MAGFAPRHEKRTGLSQYLDTEQRLRDAKHEKSDCPDLPDRALCVSLHRGSEPPAKHKECNPRASLSTRVSPGSTFRASKTTAQRARWGVFACSSPGKQRVSVLPLPSVLSTVIVPPCALAVAMERLKPNPLPG